MAPREEIDQLGLAGEVGRREALGLSLYGALGVGMVGSWLLTRDSSQAGTGEAVSEGTRPGHVAGRVPVRGRAHRVHPAAHMPKRVAVAHRPVCTVHELIPDAPKRAIALTIDDGPDPRWTPRVLDLLAHHEVSATFCLIGVAVRNHPALVRDIVEAGHQVANHTMHHPINFGRLPGHRVDTEIGDAYKHIHQITGVTPKLFRAPGGNWSRNVLRSVARHGMLPIDWDVDPRDWSRPGSTHITRTLLHAKPGDILLCHDGGGDRSETLRSLHTVIPRLKKRDLEFVTL